MSIKHRTIVKTGMAAALSFVIMLTMAGCPIEPEPETSDDFVAVTGISGVPVQATVGTALTLTGTVEPDNATNKTIAWTVKTGAATVSGSHLTASAAGSVVVTAAIASGASETAPYTKDFTITVYPAGQVPTVTGVTVSPKTADVQKGGTLQFTATVAGTKSPSQAVSWTRASAL
jgi:endo-1,4-beta-xylanase